MAQGYIFGRLGFTRTKWTMKDRAWRLASFLRVAVTHTFLADTYDPMLLSNAKASKAINGVARALGCDNVSALARNLRLLRLRDVAQRFVPDEVEKLDLTYTPPTRGIVRQRKCELLL